MRYILILLLGLILGCTGTETPFLQTEEVQLADPIADSDSIVFINSAAFSINQVSDNSEIHYSLNNQPFKLWSGPITLLKTSNIEYFTKKKGYQNSDTLHLVAIKSSNYLLNAHISIKPKPSPKYSGSGAQSLIDLKKGSIQFSSNNDWLGFQNDKIEITIILGKEIVINNIDLSFLDDRNSWIHLPNKITALTNNKIVGHKTLPPYRQETEPDNWYLEIPLLNQKYTELKIIIEPLSEIPSGFPGEGNKPWLFIDEIILN